MAARLLTCCRVGAWSVLPPVDPHPLQPQPAPPPAPPLECHLLRLPDHLLLEVGLWLDDLGDLHTLLRCTCRLSQIIEAPRAPAPAAMELQPSSSSDGCGQGERGGSTTRQAGGAGHGHDGASAPTSVPPAATAPAAVPDKPWPPSADIQARWLLRWCSSSDPLDPPFDAFFGPAWDGDVDVTLAVLERLPPGLVFGRRVVCPLLVALSGPDAEPEHTLVVDAVIRRHWGAVAALPPLDHAMLLGDAAQLGSLAIARAVLRLGTGLQTCGGLMEDNFRRYIPDAVAALVGWDSVQITAADVALCHAARIRQGAMIEELLVAEQEGRASLSPLSVLLALVSVLLGDGWADGRGPMAAALELLTAAPDLRNRVRQAVGSGAMPCVVINDLFIQAMAAVTSGPNVAMMERLVSALPRLRLADRAVLAFKHIKEGHSVLLPLLLDPHGPHDASSPVDADDTSYRAAAIMAQTDVQIMEDLLVVAACWGSAEAAEAVLATADKMAGVGGAALMADGRALHQAAERRHAGMVRVLLGGGRRGAVLTEVRAGAARAALRHGYVRVAVDLIQEEAGGNTA